MKIKADALFLTSVFFFAPIGKALLPGIGGDSLRFFYLLLPFSVAYLLMKGVSRKIVMFLVLYVVVALVSVILSAGLIDTSGGLNQNPVVRLIVHIMIVSFFVMAADRGMAQGEDFSFGLVRASFIGFFAVTVFGLVLWAGNFVGAVPYAIVELFNVVTQHAYGYLRLSPGSYPNEFGTMASFFAVSALYLLVSKSTCMSRPLLFSVLLAGLAGVALATTRSAFVTFALGLLYVFLTIRAQHKLRMGGIAIVVGAAILFSLPERFFVAANRVLIGGYKAATQGTGSINERYVAWANGRALFDGRELIGLGFENPAVAMMHNTYLQFLFGLGFIGFFIMVLSWAAIAYDFRQRFRPAEMTLHRDLRALAIIGLINVLFFALNNHNQNHFLTWFTAFMFFASGSLAPYRYRKPGRASFGTRSSTFEPT